MQYNERAREHQYDVLSELFKEGFIWQSLISSTLQNYSELFKNGSLTGKKSAVNGDLLCRRFKIYLTATVFLGK